MKIGVISSTNCSSLYKALDILEESYPSLRKNIILIFDRETDGYRKSITMKMNSHLLKIKNNAKFSEAAANLFKQKKCDSIILFFSRLICPALHEEFKCFNIHPTLLPLWPGFGALKNTKSSGVKIFGATLHEVNNIIDGGIIKYQVASNIDENQEIERFSFIHKTILTVLHIEHLINTGKPIYSFNNLNFLCSHKIISKKVMFKCSDFINQNISIIK